MKGKINRWTGNQSWESKYKKESMIANGGNARVFLVADNSGKHFALKQLNKEYTTQRKKRIRFVREVNVMKYRLGDLPGVIPIIDFCKKDCWYVMPDAKQSMDVIKNKQFDQRMNDFLFIAETLKCIHFRNISHRDIKPTNILYYENHLCFCDFGLCHIEDSNLTQKRDNIGAKFTIAPEMRRDSKNSDPFKADVYSMGKTLWMFLTEKMDAFDGVYNPLESSIGLHYFEQYKNSNIAEIEFLLEAATKDNPDDRPTINEFCDRLSNWIELLQKKDFFKIQQSEWRMIRHYLSPSIEINSLTITEPKEIVKALHYFRLAPVLNHMLYPRGGGLDFDSSEMANEEGCIVLFSQLGTIDILKPKRFVFESFDDDRWSYFLIETDKLSPILKEEDVCDEELIEDIPGHYCDALDWVYGVYDYDSGEKLPKSARKVLRHCKGVFLIVPKFGYYNQQTSTYDGRQNNCTAEDFKKYIQQMKNFADEKERDGYSFGQIVCALNRLSSPFNCYEDDLLPNKSRTVNASAEFVADIFENIDFSDIISSIEDKDSPVTFAVYIECINLKALNFESLFVDNKDKTRQFLCNDGKIRNTSWKDNQVLKLHDRQETIHLVERIKNTIDGLYRDAGFENEGIQSTYCSMTLCKTGKPTHIFSRKEIEKLMKHADDRCGNTLVIDEFGFAQVIPGHFDNQTYPVSQETWCSRNNYVGKYSCLFDLDESYKRMLEGWLYYLERGYSVHKECVEGDLTVEELLKKIKEHY